MLCDGNEEYCSGHCEDWEVSYRTSYNKLPDFSKNMSSWPPIRLDDLFQDYKPDNIMVVYAGFLYIVRVLCTATNNLPNINT